MSITAAETASPRRPGRPRLDRAPDQIYGEGRLVVRVLPVDAFWSISVYNADGFFEASDAAGCSVNQFTAR